MVLLLVSLSTYNALLSFFRQVLSFFVCVQRFMFQKYVCCGVFHRACLNWPVLWEQSVVTSQLLSLWLTFFVLVTLSGHVAGTYRPTRAQLCLYLVTQPSYFLVYFRFPMHEFLCMLNPSHQRTDKARLCVSCIVFLCTHYFCVQVYRAILVVISTMFFNYPFLTKTIFFTRLQFCVCEQ